MTKFVANAGNAVTTLWAKMMSKTGCVLLCHNPEAPEELFK